jgi:pilus assembly protein CpaF
MGLLNRINITQKDENEKVTKEVVDFTTSFDNNSIKKTPHTTYNKEKELKHKIQRRIIEEFGNDQDIDKLVSKIDSLAIEIIKNEQENFRNVNVQKIVQELIDDVTGYGPINPLLQDPDVTEVMVNGPEMVYFENEQIMQVIEKIVAPLGRRIDESSPMVDARLPDGSRVNAIIPPLALNGPTISIRKFSKDPYTIKDLVNFNTLTREMAIFLEACVKAKLNILISGGTSSGKTTTLNVLSSFIANDERIITIEDAAELQLSQEHVISLEARPANIEGFGAVTIRDLVRNSLRMRPDRIVVGEVRGEETLDMLQAMNTGHEGSLATGHANSSRDMITRLETMVLMAGIELPVKAIRQQIAGAINLIVQQSRLKDGSRKIVNITEVQGLEGDVVVLQDVFVFKQKSIGKDGKVIGKLVPTGIIPSFYECFEACGINLPSSLFSIEEW